MSMLPWGFTRICVPTPAAKRVLTAGVLSLDTKATDHGMVHRTFRKRSIWIGSLSSATLSNLRPDFQYCSLIR